MMDSFRKWHSWYVRERWEPPIDEPIIHRTVEQLEELPGMPRRLGEFPMLKLRRRRLERIWSELNQVVNDELAHEYTTQVYYSYLKDLREFMNDDGAAVCWWEQWHCRANEINYCRRKWYQDDRIGDVLQTIEKLLRSYATELAGLKEIEHRTLYELRKSTGHAAAV